MAKYRTRYSALMSRFQGLLKENEKTKIEVKQVEEKMKRKLNDVTEV